MGAGGTEYIDGYDAWPTRDDVRKMFRSLTMNSEGNLLAAAYYTHDPSHRTLGGLPHSGVMLFSLAADGTIAKVADLDQFNYSRAARFFSKPN